MAVCLFQCSDLTWTLLGEDLDHGWPALWGECKNYYLLSFTKNVEEGQRNWKQTIHQDLAHSDLLVDMIFFKVGQDQRQMILAYILIWWHINLWGLCYYTYLFVGGFVLGLCVPTQIYSLEDLCLSCFASPFCLKLVIIDTKGLQPRHPCTKEVNYKKLCSQAFMHNII